MLEKMPMVSASANKNNASPPKNSIDKTANCVEPCVIIVRAHVWVDGNVKHVRRVRRLALRAKILAHPVKNHHRLVDRIAQYRQMSPPAPAN